VVWLLATAQRSPVIRYCLYLQASLVTTATSTQLGADAVRKIKTGAKKEVNERGTKSDEGSQGSSVSIGSDYGLDDRAIGVRSPAEAKDFSSDLCVQTGSEAYPASCTMGTGGPFPGVKARSGRDSDDSPPSSAEVKN
jgi:hypothetical protein